MKQHTLTTIGLFLLLLIGCQAYELTYRYQEERKKLHDTIEGAFRLAIKQEVTLRLQRQKPADPKNPQFIIRNAKDMTPEERARLKGDTLTLSEAKEAGIGDNFVDVFAQRLQEAVIQSGRPLRIDAVDSLFHANLEEKDLIVNTQVFLLNSERQITDSTGGFKRDRPSGYLTPVIPVGTSGSYYLQGYAELSFWRPLNYMRLAILLSGLTLLGTIGLLVGLLRRIRQSSRQLAERETVIHTAIHDLKAPLNIAYSTLDLIMLTEQQQERLKRLETGKRQIRLLVEVIESMLSLLKRPNSSQDGQKLEPVDLPALVEGILHTERQCHPEQCPITQITREASFPATVRINRIALMRCLHNAVDNAMTYGDAPTQVHVRLSLRGKQIQIDVEDSGWGIPSSQLKRLGTPFYRVTRMDKPIPSGFGLGLSSIFWLMKEIGGSARIHSVEGEGTQLTLLFPFYT